MPCLLLVTDYICITDNYFITLNQINNISNMDIVYALPMDLP